MELETGNDRQKMEMVFRQSKQATELAAASWGHRRGYAATYRRLSLVPRPIPSFSMFHAKKREA